MSNHVSEWLNTYFDGELTGRKLHQVEEHLAGCKACRAELESLDRVSSVLHEVPTPELMPVERFASQVNLRLPAGQAIVTRKKVMEIGWWMIPVGILAAWAFVGTAFILSDILLVAGRLGVLRGLSDWLASGPANNVYVSTTIGQLGLLSGNGLNWAEATETFTRISLPQVILQISIAVLYLSWMAIWWARHALRARQVQGQALES